MHPVVRRRTGSSPTRRCRCRRARAAAGSHLLLFHASVNSVVYSRVGETGAWKKPPGVSGEPHASRSRALLPSVVSVDRLLLVLTSHGEARGQVVQLRRPARCSRAPGAVVAHAPSSPRRCWSGCARCRRSASGWCRSSATSAGRAATGCRPRSRRGSPSRRRCRGPRRARSGVEGADLHGVGALRRGSRRSARCTSRSRGWCSRSPAVSTWSSGSRILTTRSLVAITAVGGGDDLLGRVVGDVEGVLGTARRSAVTSPWKPEDSLDCSTWCSRWSTVAGDGVDHDGVGLDRVAVDVDDVGLDDRADGAVGHRQAAHAGELVLGEAGDLEGGPALARRRLGRRGQVAERDVEADRVGGLRPSPAGLVEGRRRHGVGALGQRRGDVGDPAVGDADGDHAAEGGREAPPGPVKLWRKSTARRRALRQPLVVDQLQGVDLGDGEAQRRSRCGAARSGRRSDGVARSPLRGCRPRAGSRTACRRRSSGRSAPRPRAAVRWAALGSATPRSSMSSRPSGESPRPRKSSASIGDRGLAGAGAPVAGLVGSWVRERTSPAARRPVVRRGRGMVCLPRSRWSPGRRPEGGECHLTCGTPRGVVSYGFG